VTAPNDAGAGTSGLTIDRPVNAAASAEGVPSPRRRADGQGMRILTFTTLYPNVAMPHHGVFVENRLRHLLAGGGFEAHVVAPVPWFPFSSPRFGSYSANARVPRHEERHGLAIDHPRYPVIPKVGMTAAPALLYRSAKPAVRGVIDQGFDFDLIDAHYFYPDGVAAAMLGRAFGRPVTITARGTDINLIPKFALPRRMILWAARRAAGLVAVCTALKDEMVALGIDPDRITVLRNGVDLEMFRPVDRTAARARFGLGRPTVLSVGHLIARKGHDLVIQAMPELPQAELLIVGEGPERAALENLAHRVGVADRVRLLGGLPHHDMKDIYSAADVLVLASSREGWANVLLEAMACGTPVVASNVWGTPEVVAAPQAGLLLPERSGPAIAAAVTELLAHPRDRAATRAYAERFDWDDTTSGQRNLFHRIGEGTSR